MAVKGSPLNSKLQASDDKKKKKKSPSNAKVQASYEKKKKKSGKQLFNRIWTFQDEITILEGFADFSSKTKMKDEIKKFYNSKKDSLNLNATYLQVRHKIRKLRDKYKSNVDKLNEGVNWKCVLSTPHDVRLFSLSVKVWGNANHIEHAFRIDDDEMKKVADYIEKSDNQELKRKLKELRVNEIEVYLKRIEFMCELNKAIYEAYINSISDLD